MKNPLFQGACTALVTPFRNGKVHIPMLEKLLQRQMDAGIGTIALCGTTGESPTLSDEEIRRSFSADFLILCGFSVALRLSLVPTHGHENRITPSASK